MPVAERGKRAYSAAAMAAAGDRLGRGTFPGGEAASAEPYPPRYPERHPSLVAPVDDSLSLRERFQRQVAPDPIGALRTLGFMTRKDLGHVNIKDIRRILYWLSKDIKLNPIGTGMISRSEAIDGLRAARIILFAQPSVANSRRDAFLGKTMKGRTLRALLRVSLRFDLGQLTTETFQERLLESHRTGQLLLDLDGFGRDLEEAGEWAMAVHLLPGPSPAIPEKYWTADLVSVVMRANLIVQRPWEACELFHSLPDLQPTPDTVCALLQALLETGDIPAAQKAAQLAKQEGVSFAKVQVSMLRGYRKLGYDANVEHHLRRSMEQLQQPMETPVLNELMRLRLDAADYDGATRVLNEFQHFGPDSVGPVPDTQTAIIAITLIVKQRGEEVDVEAIRRLWADIVSGPQLVTDATVAHLCRTLGRMGLIDDVYAIFQAAVRGEESPWKLPDGFMPGVVLANTAMLIMLRARGFQGLSEVSGLMREGHIKPDQRTILTVLDFTSQNAVTTPASLTLLLRDLNARTKNQTSPDQLNFIMSEVIRAAFRSPAARAKYFGNAEVDPNDKGTMELPNQLRGMLGRGLEDIQNEGRVEAFGGLRTRLMYDALALGDAPADDSIRSTWQAFMLRGYKPGPKHYLSLMRAYASIGAMDEAEDVLRVAASDGVSPTTGMYIVLIHGWGRVGKVGRAKKAYYASKKGSHVDAASLSAILQTLSISGRPRIAAAIAKEDLPKIDRESMTPTLVLQIAHAMRKDNDVPGAVAFMAQHCQRNSNGLYTLTPSLLGILNKMVKYLEKHPDEAALALARTMVEQDEQARPAHSRRQTSLSKSVRSAIVDKLDVDPVEKNPTYTSFRSSNDIETPYIPPTQNQ